MQFEHICLDDLRIVVRLNGLEGLFPAVVALKSVQLCGAFLVVF